MALLWKTATNPDCDACDDAAEDAGVEIHGFAKWHDDFSLAERRTEKKRLMHEGFAGCEEHPAW